MKKTRLFGLSAILLASIFTSCDLTYFDNEIEDFTWEGGLNAPLGHATYTLSELFEELEVSELEITLNPKISQYNLKNKVYPKGRSTLGMPGVKTKKQQKKWKQKR